MVDDKNSDDESIPNEEKTPAPDVTDSGLSNGASESSEAALEAMKKQYLYLRADFENFRRQSIKERSDLIKFGSEPVIREFLGVLDNLERASETEVTPETLEEFKKGIALIVAQFKKSLEKFGVEVVDA